MVCLNDEADASVDGCGHRFCATCITTWCYFHSQANCPTCRTEIREIRDLDTAAVLHEFEMVDNQPPPVACSDVFVHQQRKLAKQHNAAAGAGSVAFASDDRAGEDGGSAAADDCDAAADDCDAAADDCDADAHGSLAAIPGGGADAADGARCTTATDEPGAAGGSRLDVEQTIGLLLELNVKSARKSKAAANVTAPTVTTDVIAAAVAA